MKKWMVYGAVLVGLAIIIVLVLVTQFRLGQKKRIAFVFKTLSNPFFVEMDKGVKAAITKHPEYELITQATERETDIEKQLQIVENLIAQNVDVICITPNDSKGIVPAIVKANKKGIPVIIVDTKVDQDLAKQAGAKFETFIGSDNFLGGQIAGEYITKRLDQKGLVAILEGIPGHETAISRRDGFKEAIKKYPDIKVVASQTAEWSREKALNVFQNILEANPKLDALFASNDEMALGAIQAIKASGRSGKILVVGFDATDDAKAAIKRGEMEGSVAQLPAEMGRLAIENAVKLLEGKTIDRVIPTKVEMVTKDKLS